MEIRRYERDDLEKIIRLFRDTVHKVNIKDYTQKQVDVWAPDSIDMDEWDKTLFEHYTFVVVKDDVIIGFEDIDVSGYLDRLYVHYDYLRQGVATLLCAKLESMIDSDLTIITHASVTAKPFFEKRGYRVVKEQFVERKGVFLKKLHNGTFLPRKGESVKIQQLRMAIFTVSPRGLSLTAFNN